MEVNKSKVFLSQRREGVEGRSFFPLIYSGGVGER